MHIRSIYLKKKHFFKILKIDVIKKIEKVKM
jgi:hypothetical protein